MRRDAWRRDPSAYPLRGTLMPRITDVDVWQHLNNSALIGMHGEALQQALRSVFGPQAWKASMPALGGLSGATDFLAEAYYPEPVDWGARVMGVCSDGVRVATALFQQAQCVGLHEALIACWENGRIVPPGAPEREAIRAAGLTTTQPLAPLTRIPALSEFPWSTRLRVRFGDSDARRLASDAFLARSAEQMRVEFLGEAFSALRERLGSMLVAHVSVRWLHRAAPGTHWDVGCAVSQIGERSLAVRGAMFDGERCVATCESVMVAIDPATRRSAALPPGTREQLARWQAHLPAVS